MRAGLVAGIQRGMWMPCVFRERARPTEGLRWAATCQLGIASTLIG